MGKKLNVYSITQMSQDDLNLAKTIKKMENIKGGMLMDNYTIIVFTKTIKKMENVNGGSLTDN